MTQIFFE